MTKDHISISPKCSVSSPLHGTSDPFYDDLALATTVLLLHDWPVDLGMFSAVLHKTAKSLPMKGGMDHCHCEFNLYPIQLSGRPLLFLICESSCLTSYLL
jgi:hypothetical protein